MTIGIQVERDGRRAVDILVRAFHDDPVMNWMSGHPGFIRTFFGITLPAFEPDSLTCIEARGRGAEAAAAASLPLTAVLLLVTGIAVWRAYLRSGAGARDFPRYAAALILAFMLGSKVLSPQYAVWLLPLVPLCAGGAAGLAACLLFLAACLTTTLVFPTHYADLLNLRSPGPQLLMLRNTLLAALWGVLIFAPAGKGSGGSPT